MTLQGMVMVIEDLASCMTGREFKTLLSSLCLSLFCFGFEKEEKGDGRERERGQSWRKRIKLRTAQEVFMDDGLILIPYSVIVSNPLLQNGRMKTNDDERGTRVENASSGEKTWRLFVPVLYTKFLCMGPTSWSHVVFPFRSGFSSFEGVTS